MTTLKTPRFLALLAVLAVPACDDSGVQPLAESLTVGEAAELTVIEDPGAVDVPVEITDVTIDVAASFGDAGSPDGRTMNAQARIHFAAAQEALGLGDHRRALEEAREGRRLVARALVATGGAEAVEALIERIEELALTLASDDGDVFDDPETLAARLQELAGVARDLLAQGHPVAAGERALLGEQLIRLYRGRRGHRGDVHPDRARLAVALAGTAVALADRLVNADDTPVRDSGSSDARDRQNRWLVHAKRMLSRAQEALTAGRYARAVHFAQHAHWSALKAVILPGGITEAELTAMTELANRLYREAIVAVGDDPGELEARLLARAGRLIELGERKLEEGYTRGVAALWSAAVISRWLIG